MDYISSVSLFGLHVKWNHNVGLSGPKLAVFCLCQTPKYSSPLDLSRAFLLGGFSPGSLDITRRVYGIDFLIEFLTKNMSFWA